MLWNPDQNIFLLCCILFVAQLCHPITPLPSPGVSQASHCNVESVPLPGLCSCLTCFLECYSHRSDPAPSSTYWTLIISNPHSDVSSQGVMLTLSPSQMSLFTLLPVTPWFPSLIYQSVWYSAAEETSCCSFITTYLSRPLGISVEDRDNLLANGPIPLYPMGHLDSFWSACEWSRLGPLATSVLTSGTQGLCYLP